jgi:hypothetical protein
VHSHIKRRIDTFFPGSGNAFVVQPVVGILAIVEVQVFPSPTPYGI